MIDFGFDKLALIGAVALVVIGPERLPKVARTVGHLVGKAQRYMADVRAEVNRSIELEELKKMKSRVEEAARGVETSSQSYWNDLSSSSGFSTPLSKNEADDLLANHRSHPEYVHPRKKWRVKRTAMPQWYKHQQGIRTRTLSGAARVARYRPKVANSYSSSTFS